MNQIALILLQNGSQLVSLIEQLEYEPSVHLHKPHTFTGKSKLTLSRWPEHATDEHILFKSDSLLTVCDPTPELRSAYMKKVGLTEADLMPKPVPVILNEEEQVPPEYEEDYEPRYVEEA